MRGTCRLKAFVGPLAVLTALLGSFPLANAQQVIDSSDVPDDMLTIVVGTRFVSAPEGEISPRLLFTDRRIPLDRFNETDHCIDDSALEMAKTYFETLGRMLAKAGYYYIIPDADVMKSIATCENIKGQPPQAWVEKKTKIIAFGRVVPTTEAPALEQSIR